MLPAFRGVCLGAVFLCVSGLHAQSAGGATLRPGGQDSVTAAQAARQSAADAELSSQVAEMARQKAERAATSSQTQADAGSASAQMSAEEAASSASNAKNAKGSETSAQAAADLSARVAKTAQESASKAMQAAGVALIGSTNVSDNVTIEAVMLPQPSARRVFGREIADAYAVIQVTVDNQSQDSTFVLQSIFLDYSAWALSGMHETPGPCPVSPRLLKSQIAACPGQVSSVEYRVVRGELQDAASWSWRNGVVRATVLAGSIATGLPALHSAKALGYVSSYTGEFVPGLQVFWPDPTVAQLNRVSDLGFQTNKVFPKGTSDVVYAFFPINRFLSPGLKRIFLNAPAFFVSPAEMFVDTKFNTRHWFQFHKGQGLDDSNLKPTRELITEMVLRNTASNSLVGQHKTSPADRRIAERQVLADLISPLNCDLAGNMGLEPCYVREIFGALSLNRIHVNVGGQMAVNTLVVPPNLQQISFVNGPSTASTWAGSCKPQSGSVTGRFMDGGLVSVSRMTDPNGATLKPDEYFDVLPLGAVPMGSDDSTLNFTMTLKKKVVSGSTVYFQVTKYDPADAKKANAIRSMAYQFPVLYTTAPGQAADPADGMACKDRPLAAPSASAVPNAANPGP